MFETDSVVFVGIIVIASALATLIALGVIR